MWDLVEGITTELLSYQIHQNHPETYMFIFGLILWVLFGFFLWARIKCVRGTFLTVVFTLVFLWFDVIYRIALLFLGRSCSCDAAESQ